MDRVKLSNSVCTLRHRTGDADMRADELYLSLVHMFDEPEEERVFYELVQIESMCRHGLAIARDLQKRHFPERFASRSRGAGGRSPQLATERLSEGSVSTQDHGGRGRDLVADQRSASGGH